MAAAHQRFSSEISDGRLTIVGAAVAAENGSARLAIADDMTIWSTLDAEFVARNSGKTRYRYVDVPAVQFAELLREHGVPYYLKVDIEGSDMLALGALHAVSERSQYVSLESTVSSTDATAERVESEFAELWSLGYRRFQSSISASFRESKCRHSRSRAATSQRGSPPNRAGRLAASSAAAG